MNLLEIVKEELSLVRTSSGIPVIVERMPYARSAAFSVYIGKGSRDEPEDKAGIAHMLEHMLFKGTKERTPRQMAEQIEAAGGEQNGYTTKEVTSYQASTLDETASIAQDLLADMVLEPLLDAESLKTEKTVVVQEIKMLENDPQDYIHVLFLESMWGKHPMGRSESGFERTVNSISSDDLREFFETNYKPPNLAIVAAGNVQSC